MTHVTAWSGSTAYVPGGQRPKATSKLSPSPGSHAGADTGGDTVTFGGARLKKSRWALGALAPALFMLSLGKGLPSRDTAASSATERDTAAQVENGASASKANEQGFSLSKLLGLSSSSQRDEQIWNQAVALARQGSDPLKQLSQTERNRIACAQDGVTPQSPSPESAADLAAYMAQRSAYLQVDPTYRSNTDTPPAMLPTGGSLGSGIICQSKPGSTEILTNHHVVANVLKGEGELSITMPDGETYPAEVVRASESYDLAYVRIKPENGKTYPTAHLVTDSKTVRQGDYAATFGHPQGLANTFTDGRISAPERDDELPVPVHQFTAPIAQGSSGGMLVTEDGSVAGVNYAMAAEGDNIGFSVHADAVADFVLAARLGLSTTNLQPGLEIWTGSKQEIADMLREWDDQQTHMRRVIQFSLSEQEKIEQDPTSVTIPPSFQQKFSIQAGDLAGYQKILQLQHDEAKQQLQELEQSEILATQVLKQFEGQQAPGTRNGVILSAVQPDSLAAQAGLQAKDIITHVNGQPVESAKAFMKLLERHFDWQAVELTVNRSGLSQTVTLNADGLAQAKSG